MHHVTVGFSESFDLPYKFTGANQGSWILHLKGLESTWTQLLTSHKMRADELIMYFKYPMVVLNTQ